VTEEATVNTDGYSGYNNLDTHFPNREVVDHNARELRMVVPARGQLKAWISLLKRGVYGTFHHGSKKHHQQQQHEFVLR